MLYLLHAQVVPRLVDLGAAELEDGQIPVRWVEGISLLVALALGVKTNE